MPGGGSDRQDEAGVVEHVLQKSEPGQVVVALGEIALATTHGEQLSDVIPIEVFECRVGMIAAEHRGARGIMQLWEKRHPKRFFERLRAVLGDHDAIFMRALRRFGFLRRHEPQETVPPIGREHWREIFVAMGDGVGMLGKGFEQKGAA